ncbi:MAG: organic solvent tolerance protein OstA [Candidatus Atelocyanobacterium thalassa isolate SIO64986]|uniref:Organic solvent tolerance protein OstA n=1 Tax=Candidatus Atelocyanobacterium thalassa isolate SIO64986 TaxID=1527444 RepID=A0A086CFM3_9CHRO|nr:MAG: organic solvent tolerance protein OstA [Candidatus Atelocyanobacterium thalassa isolate SIO64986]
MGKTYKNETKSASAHLLLSRCKYLVPKPLSLILSIKMLSFVPPPNLPIQVQTIVTHKEKQFQPFLNINSLLIDSKKYSSKPIKLSGLENVSPSKITFNSFKNQLTDIQKLSNSKVFSLSLLTEKNIDNLKRVTQRESLETLQSFRKSANGLSKRRTIKVNKNFNEQEKILFSNLDPEDQKLQQLTFNVITEDKSSISQQIKPVSKLAPRKIIGVVELIADRQEYDSEKEVVYAEGKVVMRFTNGVLLADRLWINLPNRFAVAEGNVVLDRGEQTLRGERFEYYFVQDSGVIFNASGQIYQPTTGQDFTPTLPTASDSNLIPNQILNERLALEQPLKKVTRAEGISYSFGLSLEEDNIQNMGANVGQRNGGQINRIRFQAERIKFDANGWRANNARLTNDPFSPPEVEVRAEAATYRNIAPLVDEVKLTNSRVVLDQINSFPTQDRLIFDHRDRQPGVVSFGFDDRDRGGLFVERGFNIVDTDNINWEITPQYYIQKAVSPQGLTVDDQNTDLFQEDKDDIELISPPAFGLVSEINANLNNKTTFFARTSLTSLEFDDVEDRLRVKSFAQYRIGNSAAPHDLRFEYNYRERLFNGSLGFQTVRSSAGILLVSPDIALDKSGLQLSYQGSFQTVNADTDKYSLLGLNSSDNRISLTRLQGAVSLNRPFLLWYGKALPPDPEQGLKYTATPVLPFLVLSTGVTGVTSLYGNGDSQPSILGNIRLSGQVGNFSKPFLDYTGFNISFSQALRGDPSPFMFDRFADLKTLSWGISQQLYGPVRLGVQSSYNIDRDREINTDLFIEYSRRTYNILLRYNSVLKVGSLSLRISDFNWGGNPGPFDGTGIRPVIQGMPR